MIYLEKFNESIISRFKDFLVKKDTNQENIEPDSEIKLSDIIPDRRKNVGKKYDPRECLNMRYVNSKKTSPENCIPAYPCNSKVSFNEGFWSDRKKRRLLDKSLLAAESELNSKISGFIGKKYGFQYSVVHFRDNDKPFNEIDHDELTFKGVNIETTFYGNSETPTGVFFYLIFTDKNNDEVSIYFNEDSITTNIIDLEYANPWDLSKKTLRGTIGDAEESKSNRFNSLNYVPSEYNTIELLNELKGLLLSINDLFK